MAEILSELGVEMITHRLRDVCTLDPTDCEECRDIASLRDSHEALRADRDAARAETEARLKQTLTQVAIHNRNTDEWQGALKAAEQMIAELRAKLAEAEKDTARLNALEERIEYRLGHGYLLSLQDDASAAIDAAKESL